MTRLFLTGVSATALILLAGCESMNEPLAAAHGDATQANFEAMVEDPRPVEDAPVADASVIDAAIERYENGQVTQPRTTGGGFAGSGAGGR